MQIKDFINQRICSVTHNQQAEQPQNYVPVYVQISLFSLFENTQTSLAKQCRELLKFDFQAQSTNYVNCGF